MEPRKEHPPAIKHLCVSKWKDGISHAAIARSLEIPVTSVKGIIARFKRKGHCANAPRSGRPRVTDPRTDRLIVREVERNRFIGAASLAAQLKVKIGIDVHPQTVRNRIIDAGMNGRSARKTPYLTKQHKAKRLVYAKKLLRKFAEPEDWQRILYTDEASVQLHGSTGKVSVWRRPHEAFEEKCTVPTFKSGRQSLMVWSSVSASGVGTMHFCEASVTGEYYRHILREEIPITRELLGLPARVSFVHDGAPAHRAKDTAAVVRELGLDDLGHPPQSPDLNPIENLWAIMKQELNKDPACSLDDLKEKLADIWYNLDVAVVRKTVMSMAGRLDSVVQQKGGHTKY